MFYFVMKSSRDSCRSHTIKLSVPSVAKEKGKTEVHDDNGGDKNNVDSVNDNDDDDDSKNDDHVNDNAEKTKKKGGTSWIKW